MALKEGTNPEVGAAREIRIEQSMADHLRNITLEIVALQERPDVQAYTHAITRRNLFIEEVARIAGVEFGTGQWTLDMAAGKFVENAPPMQNGQE